MYLGLGLLCTIASSTTALSLPSQNFTRLQLPHGNFTAAQLTAHQTPWPGIPFRTLVADIIVELRYCSPIEAPESYTDDLNFALNEVEDFLLDVAPTAPVHNFLQHSGPMTLDFKVTESRRIRRGAAGLVLARLKGLIFVHGPATVGAGLLSQDGVEIGSLTLVLAPPPVEDSES